MKQLAQKTRALSLVQYATQSADLCPDVGSVILKDSYDGWLNSVAKRLLHAKASEDEPAMAFYGRPPLTSTDEIRVDRATIREGKDHRHWPREVIEKFLEAEVITRK